MKNKLLSEHLKADNYLLRDFDGNFLYSGDLIFFSGNRESQFAIIEYAKYNDKEYMLLHSPFLNYYCKAIICEGNYNNYKSYHFFKYKKSIDTLIKDMPYLKLMHFIKMYKGVIYRKQWKALPNIISKNTFICKSNNSNHCKDYDKYNTYIILQKQKSTHYEYIFRGDLLNIPF